jgi:DNA replicative helicase MCM subunit Mcm2 (Cdc46/Mcm family)
MSPTVSTEDAARALTIFRDFMNRVVGLGGIDAIVADVPASQQERLKALREIVSEYAAGEKWGAKEQEVLDEAAKKGVPNAETLVEKAVERGILFKPKEGYLNVA